MYKKISNPMDLEYYQKGGSNVYQYKVSFSKWGQQQAGHVQI
jgi:hypothetical protein